MKKHLLFGLFAAVSMLFAVSCADEEPTAGTAQTVRFTLNKPRAAGETTSDGKKAHTLIVGVYNKAGQEIPGLRQEHTNAFENSLSQEVKLQLVKGQTYTIVCWAQSGECDAYDYSDLHNIQINYDNLKVLGNEEKNDAFFGSETIVVSNASNSLNETITLHRPFAQLNFAITQEEMQAVTTAGTELLASKIWVKELATGFNAETGAITGSATQDFTFDFANFPAENSILLDLDGTGAKAYHRLSMNYLLANDGSSTTGDASIVTDVRFIMQTKQDDITIESLSTPLQRNYRTNVIGSLTNEAVFTINIDPIYYGEKDTLLDAGVTIEYNVTNITTGTPYQTIAEALATASAGDVISLAAGNYDLSSGIVTTGAIENSTNLVLRNGVVLQAAEGLDASQVILHGTIGLVEGTLRNVTITDAKSGAENLLSSALVGDVLVEDVVINCPATGTVNAFKEYSGWGDGQLHNITFKNCVINANGQRPFQFDIANATVEGCTINNPYRYCVQLGDYARNCHLTFKDNTVLNYGSTNKEFYCYVQICDQGRDKNNVVTLSGNTQSTTDANAAKTWKDVEIENKVSNVVISYLISDVAGMQWLAEQVNTYKNSFAKCNIILAADIDLRGQEWQPIGGSGNPFSGTFDGGNHTISNLKISGKKSYVGLFGYTTTGEVKNLTINNASVSGYIGVGVVAGSPYTSKYTNITLKGLIQVNGLSYVGAVGGRNAYAKHTNITVDAANGSYVNAYSIDLNDEGKEVAYRTYAGGVVGFMGEGNIVMENITSNIPVIGSTISVGGIVGIAHYGNTFINCKSSGSVEITHAGDAEDAEQIGGIAGVWMNSTSGKVTFDGCTFTGTLKTNIEGVDLSDNTIVGSKYYTNSSDGELIIQ